MRSGAVEAKSTWCHLYTGAFNSVDVSTQPEQGIYWVRKHPKQVGTYVEQLLSSPGRAKEIWTKINPDLPVNLDSRGNWYIPYIAGTTPTDEEIAKATFDIYKRTGYIILDACNRKNFIKKANGRVICIDVDLAYHPSDYISQDYVDQFVLLSRREAGDKMIFSDKYGYDAYYSEFSQGGMVITVDVIQYLLMLRYQHKDVAKYKEFEDFLSKRPDDHKASDKTDEDQVTVARSLFLDLYRRGKGFFSSGMPSVKKKLNPGLVDIVRHAQQDKTLLGYSVRSAMVMQTMHWLNSNNEVIEQSGLDVALHSLESDKIAGIKFAGK